MASKKLTINTLMQSIPAVKVIESKLEGECFKDVMIYVKHTLSLEEAMGFVNNIVATCIDDEEGDYSPELFEFAVQLYTLLYYANIDLTKDAKKAYRILYGTTIHAQIHKFIDKEQYIELINAAESKIEHWKSVLTASVASKVAEMMQKMDAMVAGGEQMMETIDSDSFKEAVARLTDGSFLSNTDTVSPAPEAEISEVEPIAAESDAKDVSGNIVYLKKKK